MAFFRDVKGKSARDRITFARWYDTVKRITRNTKRMKTKFLAKDCKIRESEREYILKRLSEIEDLFEEQSLFEVEVAMDKKNFFRVEVNVSDARDLIRAEETTKSVEASIDLVIDKLRTQAVKGKDKRRDLKERGARSIKKKLVIDGSARF
jgi:ribosomal subunit interface protein